MSRIIKPGDMGFYINRKRWHEVETDVAVGVCGFFSGKAIKPGVGVMREFGHIVPSPNLLTNLGMDAIGTSPQFSRMHLGTGTSTPSFTDTALSNFGVNVLAGNPTVTSGVSGSSPYYGWGRLTWTSAVGGATGTWTEIGISNQNTNGNLRSHALILDTMGNPTTFSVQPDEQFEGTYEFRTYAPESDSPASINLSSTPYDTVTRALRVTSASGFVGSWATSGALVGANPMYRASTSSSGAVAYAGGLAAITATVPLGASLGNRTSASSLSYTSGNHYLDSTMRWGSGAGVGQIRTIMCLLEVGAFQIEYDPTINKLTTEEVIHNQRVAWARL